MRGRASALATLALAVLAAASGPVRASPKCEALQGLTVAASAIGLPSAGAQVTSARAVAEATGKDGRVAAHCLASGVIRPVDPSAPNIEFQVALPVSWNEKALMLGGGGFNGNVPRVTGRLPNMPDGAPPAVSRGYAVFGSDSGHRDKAVEPGDFMLNKEAYDNYTGDALKKTRDVAVAVIKAAYGRAPRRSYFLGGSTGGREGLLVAGRWPRDWDGVVSHYPALHLITSLLGGASSVRAQLPPGAWMDPAKRVVLYRAALAACDGLDGAKDNLISNVKGCDAAFDPATATLDGRAVRCPDGADTGDSCLSDVQLKALARIKAGVRFGFTLASGDTGHPGYNVYSADNGLPGDTQAARSLMFFAFGELPPAFPPKTGMTLQVTYGDNFLRYGVGGGDPSFDALTVDPANPGPAAAAKLSAMSARDAADNDLSAFAARGGKLLLVQGLADTIISAKMTEQWYGGLQRRMGAAKVGSFARFYEIAGWNHGLSNTFNAAWDDLTALDNWVEKGVDPGETQVVFDTQGVPGRSRPLCLYPRWPKYRGAGDLNAASSFVCASD